jgi:hypothetical protein
MDQQDPATCFAPVINCYFLYVIFCPRNNPGATYIRPLKDCFLAFQTSPGRRRAKKFLESEGSIHCANSRVVIGNQ